MSLKGGVPGDPQHVHNMQPQQQVQTQQQQLQPQSPHQQVLGRPQQQVQRGGNPFDDDEDEPTETHPADTSMQVHELHTENSFYLMY